MPVKAISKQQALDTKRPVLYITERCVFILTDQGLKLTEVAPGIDIEKDILAHMEFEPIVADNVKAMDTRLFSKTAMGLANDILYNFQKIPRKKGKPMTLNNKNTLSNQIINKALDFGACLAGIANIAELKKSPSHLISGKMEEFLGVGTKQVKGKKQGEVHWPDNANSAIVIAVEHPLGAPDMDWWIKGLKGGTKGNAKLISVFSKLADWLETEKKIPYVKLAYHIEHGGVFMKDAAVLGGLGCIGKNNLLVTPQFGSRIRLRVMLLDKDLSSTGILDFDPCNNCKEYCRQKCPQKAFDEKVYFPEEYKLGELPGRTGKYSRIKCNIQMKKNTENGKDVDFEIAGSDKKGLEIRYCRICELVCPVGKSS